MAIVTKRDAMLAGFLTAAFRTRVLPRLDRPHAAFVRRNLQSLLGHRLSASGVDGMVRAYFRNFILHLLINDILPALPFRYAAVLASEIPDEYQVIVDQDCPRAIRG
jgi:hypothetical protein